jgi:hypothetical protein
MNGHGSTARGLSLHLGQEAGGALGAGDGEDERGLLRRHVLAAEERLGERVRPQRLFTGMHGAHGRERSIGQVAIQGTEEHLLELRHTVAPLGQQRRE